MISIAYTGIITDTMKAIYRSKRTDTKQGTVKYDVVTMFCVSYY